MTNRIVVSLNATWYKSPTHSPQEGNKKSGFKNLINSAFSLSQVGNA